MEVAIAKRTVALPLDDAVPAVLVSLRLTPGGSARGSLASLVRVTRALRELPREEFRAVLNPICKGEHP